jgi:hypothetical protein
MPVRRQAPVPIHQNRKVLAGSPHAHNRGGRQGGLNGMAIDPMNSDRPVREARTAAGGAGSVAARAALPSVALILGHRSDRRHAAPPGPVCPFVDDGRICLPDNAAERALRGFALGRKS